MSSSSTLVVPLVVRDPRFAAGRALIQQGSLEPDDNDKDNDNDDNGSPTTTTPRDGRRSAAIELFSTLLEECLAKYGSGNGGSDPDEDKNGTTTTTTTTLRSIETAPAFYEYGNALLRAAIASSSSSAAALSGHVDNDSNNNNDDDDKSRTTSGSIHKERSQAAAAAAEARAAAAGHVEPVEDDEQKPPATVISSQSSVSLPLLTGKNDMNSEHDKNDENNNEGEEDLLLALEMMENGMYRSLNNVSLDQSGWKSTMALTFVFCLSHLDIIQPTQSWRTIPQWQPLPQQLRRLLHRPCHIWNG